MSLNWKEIDLVLSELALPGCRVQRVIQPDFSTLVLSLYRPQESFDVLVGLAPSKTRLHRLSAAIPRPQTTQRFAQFLRSRIVGARVVSAAQVRSERIVRIELSGHDMTTILWARLWSGAANVIVTDENGDILDAFFRRPGRGEISGGRFDPVSGLEQAGVGSPRKIKSYEVRDLPGDGSFNARVEAAYAEDLPESGLEEARRRALQAIERRETGMLATIETLEKKRSEYENLEQLRRTADLIMSNLARIEPGARWLQVDNYFENNEPTDIELDPTKRPEQIAGELYDRYKRAKSGRERLSEELDELRAALADLAADRERVMAATDAGALSGYAKGVAPARANVKEPRVGLEFHSGDFTILVGRSAKENDHLLRRDVRGNDYWLHTRDTPGGYVFIKSMAAKSVPLEVLLDAGNLAVFFSKSKNGGRAELYYTQVKYLRRAKNGPPGLVLPTHEKNLSIRLDRSRIDRLMRGNTQSL